MNTKQFVTFTINGDLFGIDILQVREINRVLDITSVQHAPEYVRGLVNLRGQTVTVFDLARRLGLTSRKITEKTHDIILKREPVGLLVDSIGDVEEADKGEIEATPANMANIQGDYIDGVLKLKKKLLVILSPEKILEYRPVK